MEYSVRECPVCATCDAERLFTQTFAALSGGALLPGYEVVVCRRCGMGYADRIPPQSAFDAYYREMSKYENQEREGAESPYDTGRFRRIARIVREAGISANARILDIGCSTGGLLSVLREAGFHHLRGLDPSPQCAATARQLYDVEVLTGTLSNLPDLHPPFDLVLLLGVLEHICDPRAALGHIKALLAPDGLVYLQVPDASRFPAADDAPFQQFSPEHINYFSPASLANVMRLTGFSTVLSQQNNYNEGEGCAYSGWAVDAVFRREPDARRSLEPDQQTRPALCAYIRRSQEVDDRIRRVIEEIVAHGSPIIVWGVGSHTLRLLATSRLREAAIVAFVDSNPRYQDKDLNGIPIIAPAELSGRSESILISSRVFQKDIERQIREVLKLKNQLHLLYKM